MTKFLVIFPVIRPIESFDSALATALFQPGEFNLHLHVQSADMTRETEKVVARWRDWLRKSKQADAKQITIVTEPDKGLYDGVARAIDSLAPDDDCIMTWLGSDDALLPNSLATVQSILTQYQYIRWLTGQAFASAADGANCSPHPWNNYRRQDLANGKHDGRSAPFVMQEGTFWTVGLWREVGGVNRDLKLAGDWDLWRRFAQFEPLHVVDFPLGKFSQRAGRLSEDLSHYYHEVDSVIPTLKSTTCEDRNTYKVWRHIGQNSWSITVEPDNSGDAKAHGSGENREAKKLAFWSRIGSVFSVKSS